ncbi:MAG: HEAT repeat domain-containing protein, partial [Archangium sp.]|nr:HEAT repeat domain-containing protein [Archangium sp.]
HSATPTATETGAIAVSAEDIELLNSEGLRDITADELARHDVDGQHTEDTTAEARAELAHVLQAQFELGVDRFWGALLNAAVLTPELRESCVRSSARLAESLAADGRFEQAIDSFQKLLENTRTDTINATERVAALKEFRAAMTSDRVLEQLVLTLDDNDLAPKAEAAIRKLGKALAQRARDYGTKLRTPAGRSRLETLSGTLAPVSDATYRSTPSAIVSVGMVAQLDPRGLHTALETFEQLTVSDALEVVTRALNVNDVNTRRLAASRLNPTLAMTLPRVKLHKKLTDADATVRWRVIELLGAIEDPTALPLFKAMLQKPIQEEERQVIYRALASIRSPQSQAILLEELASQKDVNTRVVCIEALGNFNTPLVKKAIASVAGKLLVSPKLRKVASDVLDRLESGK